MYVHLAAYEILYSFLRLGLLFLGAADALAFIVNWCSGVILSGATITILEYT